MSYPRAQLSDTEQSRCAKILDNLANPPPPSPKRSPTATARARSRSPTKAGHSHNDTSTGEHRNTRPANPNTPKPKGKRKLRDDDFTLRPRPAKIGPKTQPVAHPSAAQHAAHPLANQSPKTKHPSVVDSHEPRPAPSSQQAHMNVNVDGQPNKKRKGRAAAASPRGAIISKPMSIAGHRFLCSRKMVASDLERYRFHVPQAGLDVLEAELGIKLQHAATYRVVDSNGDEYDFTFKNWTKSTIFEVVPVRSGSSLLPMANSSSSSSLPDNEKNWKNPSNQILLFTCIAIEKAKYEGCCCGRVS
ncbi:hypothetical protein L7F22_018556 [Adiantum nelumboides]|nr:hypothetical protein [Adiantum nelumboides]